MHDHGLYGFRRDMFYFTPAFFIYRFFYLFMRGTKIEELQNTLLLFLNEAIIWPNQQYHRAPEKRRKEPVSTGIVFIFLSFGLL